MALGLGWRPFSSHVRDVGIDLPVERHDPLHGAHREVGFAAQTPTPKAARIGMPLLQMINLQHHREPRLARRGFRRGALVLETGQVVALEAGNPGVDGGTRDVQKPADTRLAPALKIELNDLEAGLDTLRITVIVKQRELLRRGHWELLPEPFD